MNNKVENTKVKNVVNNNPELKGKKKAQKVNFSTGMKQRFGVFDCVNYLIMAIAAFITLYPVWYVFCISLSSTAAINSGTISFWPKGVNIDAYMQVLKTPKIPRAYLNSIIYTGVGTVCCLVMTTLFAYPVSRKNFIFRKPLMIMVTITMFFGGGMIPTFLLVQACGLIDSMWSLIIPNLIWTFDLIVMKNFFEGIPGEIYEAAVVDGASEFRIFTQIYVPLAKPAIASIALFFAMGQWNSYLIPSIYLNSAEKLPLQVILRDMLIDMTSQNPNSLEESKFTPEALKNATIFISVAPFLVVYPWLQKYFVKGLTVGAVKG